MFKDFDISSLKKIKPPGNNTFDTMQEIKDLTKIKINKSFVKKFDDQEAAFKQTAKAEGIKNYDSSIAGKLIEKSAPIILKLKKHFNRPRPKVLAKKMNIKMNDIEMDSMKTPSYPSGHSAQGMLIGLAYSKKYPRSRKGFMQTAKNISDSRNVAHAHYKSDSEFGKKIGKLMYNHIKNKI